MRCLREWLPELDLVLAMDARNLRDLRDMASPAEADRIVLFGDVAGLGGRDVRAAGRPVRRPGSCCRR